MNTDARDIPDLVRWYEGMLLLPEHFQAAAGRQETLAPYLAFAAAPYAWGVNVLETRLDNGAFEVTRIEAIMPDGMLVAFPDRRGTDEPLQLDLKELDKEARAIPRTRKIFLVAPAWSDNALGTGGQARYRASKGSPLAKGDPVPPPADPSDVEQPWLRPNLRLMCLEHDAPPEKYAYLTLAQVTYQDMAYDCALFQPPCFAVGEGQPVYEKASAVRKRLREEADNLDERLQSREGPSPGAPARFDPNPDALSTVSAPAIPRTAGNPEQRLLDAMRLLEQKAEALTLQSQARIAAIGEELIQTLEGKADRWEREARRADLRALVRTLPRLEALLATGRVHPFTLYLTLCDVLGDIADLRGQLTLPDVVPSYDHHDMLPPIAKIADQIGVILDRLNARHRKIYFDLTSPGHFQLDLSARTLGLEPKSLGDVLIVGAVIGAAQDPSAVQVWMKDAVIATAGNLENLKRSRVSGANRRPIERDDALDLEAARGTLLYQIEVRRSAVDLLHGPLFVFNDGGPGAPTEIALFVATHPGATPS